MKNNKPIISIIVAMGENNVIGKNNDLPWARLPADMEHFKSKTMSHPIITGRKNYESIPKKYRPLIGRVNIIVTRNEDFREPRAIIVKSIESALETAYKVEEDEIFIIGGGQIYKQALVLDIVDRLYITKVHAIFDGDVFFPIIDESLWNLVDEKELKADDKNIYDLTFCTFEKVKKD
jgi:dihydrofolate reductase